MIADVIGRGQIVGDVENGDAEIGLQLVQRLQNRGAQRGIHHGDRFVGDRADLGCISSARATTRRWRCPPLSWCGKRPSVSSGRSPTLISASFIISRGLLLGIGQLVVLDRFFDDVVDLVERVEDRKGILEDGLHLLAKLQARPCSTCRRSASPCRGPGHWSAVRKPRIIMPMVVLPLPLSPAMEMMLG